jgi:hypothetical protein
LISVDARREGRARRSGDTAGRSITKASALASSYGNARASPTVADANAATGGAAEADRASSATAPATRAPSSRSRTTSCRTATCSSTLDHGKQRHLRRRRPRLRGVRRRRPERVRVRHHLRRLRPVLLLEAVHAHTPILRSSRLQARRRRLPAARLAGHRLRQEPTSKSAGQPTWAPAPCASTSTARPAPPSRPGTPANASARGGRSPRSPRSRSRPARTRSRRAPPPGTG